ncbi:hypothetical protein CY34DRAFT_810231 [Suillus luteus UH-Slu-Lm8-n1]|uniref:Uncharacterized protein n=1 Tax=Suillus luteus UH-Slu-Lm8-n1 TaxID=930992 RepID=A0A0D0B0F8_9AGAM|nr:hypothetical protein CY34DRAFT_810231 [Suillus luteus UH-Slu-Lm8-n1]
MTNFTGDGEVGSHVGGTDYERFEYAIGLDTGKVIYHWGLLWSLPTSPIIDLSINRTLGTRMEPVGQG